MYNNKVLFSVNKRYTHKKNLNILLVYVKNMTLFAYLMKFMNGLSMEKIENIYELQHYPICGKEH